MENMDGTRESHNAFEMNVFVDAILKTVLQNAKSRKIVFSSFNPDICTVLRYKQNKYPVLLLTQGVNTKYDQYLDQRTHNVNNGSHFAATADILGLSVIAEDIQRDPSQVELVKNRGQILFCWTDDQNNPEIVKYLKNLGVDGIICDRIDENSAKETKQSIFLVDENEDDDDDEANDNVAEHTLKSRTSSCSCSPSRNSNFDTTIMQIRQGEETIINALAVEGKDNKDIELTTENIKQTFVDVKEEQKMDDVIEGSDSDGDLSPPTTLDPEQLNSQNPTFSGLFQASAMAM